MNTPRHILVVEDTSEDYELIQYELRKDGEQFSTKQVNTTEELVHELDRQMPDIVLCDHGSARWDSVAVLKQVRERSQETPVILVTGAMGQQAISRAFDHGANDLVFKYQLAGLGPAVRRAIRLSEEIRRRRAAEQERDELRQELESRRRGQGTTALIRICAECKKIPEAGQNWVSMEQYLTQHHAIEFSHGLCPVCVRKYYADFA